MKARNVLADARIFQGTITQAETTAAIMQPLLILIHFGRRTVRSLAAEIEFAVMLVPTWAMYHASAAKKAAHLPPGPLSSQRAMMSSGFQRYSPVKTRVQEVVTIPSTPHTVKMIGRKGSWINWPLALRA
jgi:hypothetical protein